LLFFSNTGAAGCGDRAARRGGAGGGATGGAAQCVGAVSDAVGPLFESEARNALTGCFSQVCPWLASRTEIITRFELSFHEETRQADIFCYVVEDGSHSACVNAPEAGVFVVWPDATRPEVTEPALDALAIPSDLRFSPGDATRMGPQKYLLGEAYSGISDRASKVRQLDREVDFMRRRAADRLGVDAPDVTQVVSVAALVFSAAGGGNPSRAFTPRREQVADALTLVRACLSGEGSCPSLRRLAAAGRLLLVLLSKEQAPQTYHARDVSAALVRIEARLASIEE
jgi:hypothetical protein